MFEKIYSYEELKKYPSLAIILGLFYSILSIVLAIFVFPEDPALVTVAFISLMFLPTLYHFFKKSEEIESKEKEFSAKRLFEDNKTTLKLYLYFSLGVFIVFAVFSMFLPEMATNHLFREQVKVLTKNVESANSVGNAINNNFGVSLAIFLSILANNFKVFIVTFLISLLAGTGAIFFITWNVSVWATVFGNLAKMAGETTHMNPLGFFVVILAAVLPHAILEVSSYILSGISGSVISSSLLSEKMSSEKFKAVIIYNIILFFVALFILILAAIVETYVLQNATYYRGLYLIVFGK